MFYCKPLRNPYSEQKKRREKRIRSLISNSRYLADSSMNTYFNKAVFMNYGHNNLKQPKFLDCDYLKTHNTNP